MLSMMRRQLNAWVRKLNRKWVRQLNKLRAVYAQERMQRKRGQTTLNSFIKQMPTTAEGQEQATVARSQTRRNVRQNRIRKYKQKKLDWVKKTEVQTVNVYERKRKIPTGREK